MKTRTINMNAKAATAATAPKSTRKTSAPAATSRRKPAAPRAVTTAPPRTPTRERRAQAGSITLPLQVVPTTWKRAAKDQNFPSVEEWAAAMLDIMSWPGDRMTLPMTHEQFNRWCRAGRANGQNVHEWIEGTLDAASQAVEAPQKGGRP